MFLRKFFAPGQTMLDPFVGSGTTLVQANDLGIHPVGYDISAFNVLLCKAKTAEYDLALVQNEILDILECTRRATQKAEPQLSLLFEHQADYTPSTLGGDTEYLIYWYAPRALQELLTYRSFIDTGEYRYKHLLEIILSRAARSARLTPHHELDFPKQPQREPYRCHQHGRTCEPTDSAYKSLHRYSLDTIRRIREFALVRTSARVEVYHADSRTAQFPPVDGVFTTPPYVGLIDYHEQHACAYHLLGLQDLREGDIGAAANGSSERAKAQYVQDIVTVFRNAMQVMPPGGRLIVVANDKYRLTQPLPNRWG
ncbi:MAG: DNA methyltransferase [Armatimonadota bacterium]